MQDRSIGSIKKNAFYHIKCSIINLGDISSPLYFFFLTYAMSLQAVV